MGEITKEIDLALKNTVHLLSTISGERIRDEFLKGIKSAKSQKKFFEMLDKYHLFDWIFKGLTIDLSFLSIGGNYNHDDYIVLLARLLKKNNIDVLKKKLNELKYSVEEVKSITFLIAMLQLDIDTAVALKKAEQHAGVSQDQIRSFCGKENISSQLLDAFEGFRLTISGPEAMEITGLKPGKELGAAIHKMETKNFEKLLGMS